MATNIQLRAFQIADLAVIRDIGCDALATVRDSLYKSERCLQPPELRGILFAKLEPDAADALMRQLLSLRGLMRRTRFTVDEVIDGLRTGLRGAVSKWSDTEFNEWKAVEPLFSQILDSRPVRMVAKTSDLAFEYANLLQSARIVTDVRPVFNDHDAEQLEIDAAIVSFTLRLSFDSRDGDHGLSIALDDTDVRALKTQCERALLKGKMLKSLMQNAAKLPTVIVGGADDEP